MFHGCLSHVCVGDWRRVILRQDPEDFFSPEFEQIFATIIILWILVWRPSWWSKRLLRIHCSSCFDLSDRVIFCPNCDHWTARKADEKTQLKPSSASSNIGQKFEYLTLLLIRNEWTKTKTSIARLGFLRLCWSPLQLHLNTREWSWEWRMLAMFPLWSSMIWCEFEDRLSVGSLESSPSESRWMRCLVNKTPLADDPATRQHSQRFLEGKVRRVLFGDETKCQATSLGYLRIDTIEVGRHW